MLYNHLVLLIPGALEPDSHLLGEKKATIVAFGHRAVQRYVKEGQLQGI